MREKKRSALVVLSVTVLSRKELAYFWEIWKLYLNDILNFEFCGWKRYKYVKFGNDGYPNYEII